MGIMVKYFGCFYVYFFMVIILCIYVYIVMGDYLCVFMYIYVYIIMGDYLCLFLIKCVKLWAYILTLYLKFAKRLTEFLSL